MDFSEITEDLFIGRTPRGKDYELLHKLGVRLVINMRLEKPPSRDRHVASIHYMWLPTIDSPGLVIPIRFLSRGACAALETIRSGGKVYAHCGKGRHRGVAMGAAILIALGHPPEVAMEMIKERRPIADPDAFYIRSRILRFARQWQATV